MPDREQGFRQHELSKTRAAALLAGRSDTSSEHSAEPKCWQRPLAMLLEFQALWGDFPRACGVGRAALGGYREVRGLGGNMRRVRRLAEVLITGAAVMLLAGCSVGPQVERERRGNLNAAIREFDPSSISTMSCDVSGGSIQPQRGFTRLIVFDGADSWQPVVDRFSELGYDGTVNSPGLSLARKDGILVVGRLIADRDDQADLVPSLIAKGCDIPPDGAVMVSFEERAVPVGGN